MVLFGGLEVVAAGALIHKFKQNKREQSRIEAEEDLRRRGWDPEHQKMRDEQQRQSQLLSPPGAAQPQRPHSAPPPLVQTPSGWPQDQYNRQGNHPQQPPYPQHPYPPGPSAPPGYQQTMPPYPQYPPAGNWQQQQQQQQPQQQQHRPHQHLEPPPPYHDQRPHSEHRGKHRSTGHRPREDAPAHREHRQRRDRRDEEREPRRRRESRHSSSRER